MKNDLNPWPVYCFAAAVSFWYLTTFFNCIDYTVSNKRRPLMLYWNACRRKRSRLILIYYSSTCLVGLKRTTINCIERWSVVRGSNSGPSEYEVTAANATTATRTVTIIRAGMFYPGQWLAKGWTTALWGPLNPLSNQYRGNATGFIPTSPYTPSRYCSKLGQLYYYYYYYYYYYHYHYHHHHHRTMLWTYQSWWPYLHFACVDPVRLHSGFRLTSPQLYFTIRHWLTDHCCLLQNVQRTIRPRVVTWWVLWTTSLSIYMQQTAMWTKQGDQPLASIILMVSKFVSDSKVPILQHAQCSVVSSFYKFNVGKS